MFKKWVHHDASSPRRFYINESISSKSQVKSSVARNIRKKIIDQLTSAAMVQIMEQCQEENVLTEFMEHYGTELIEMLFKELTREEDLEISRLDGYDAGQKDGFTKGEKSGFTKGEKSGERKAALDIAKGMQKEHIASDVIAKITGLTLAEVESL